MEVLKIISFLKFQRFILFELIMYIIVYCSNLAFSTNEIHLTIFHLCQININQRHSTPKTNLKI